MFKNLFSIEDFLMSLIAHMETEFKVAEWPGDCEMQQLACDNIRELMEVFSNQGHSGSSAPYVLNVFSKLASFETISPLYGTDDEWCQVSEVDKPLYQNKRDVTVFKDGKNEDAYCIDVISFRDKNGCVYSSGTKVPVEFPWIKPEKIIINDHGLYTHEAKNNGADS